MTPTPQIYLSFNGDCEAAFRFYEERLGATRGGMFPYANSPMSGDVPPGWETKIMHGSITLGALTIAGADPPPGGYQSPQGFRIFLEADDPAETERLFNALAENARIEMPLQETFWSLRFGVLTDQFGIPWTLSCNQAPERNRVSPAVARGYHAPGQGLPTRNSGLAPLRGVYFWTRPVLTSAV